MKRWSFTVSFVSPATLPCILHVLCTSVTSKTNPCGKTDRGKESHFWVRKTKHQTGWCWELDEDTDFEESHVVIQCWDDPGLLRRARFLGGMSFNLARVQADDEASDGWYKLLSAGDVLMTICRVLF